jgi:retron-type reverse transcriptase
MELSLLAEPTGEARRTEQEGTELRMAKQETESAAGKYDVLEEILERDNLIGALKRVKGNQGSPGIDGMTVEQLKPYLTSIGQQSGNRCRVGLMSRSR